MKTKHGKTDVFAQKKACTTDKLQFATTSLATKLEKNFCSTKSKYNLLI